MWFVTAITPFIERAIATALFMPAVVLQQVRRLGRKVDDEQQVVAEPGEPGRAREPLFPRCAVRPHKAQRLALSGPDQRPDVDVRDDALFSAQLLDRAGQACLVAAFG